MKDTNKAREGVHSANQRLIEEQQDKISSLQEELLVARGGGAMSKPKSGEEVYIAELLDMLSEKADALVWKDEQIEGLKKEVDTLREEYGLLKAQNVALNEELNTRKVDHAVSQSNPLTNFSPFFLFLFLILSLIVCSSHKYKRCQQS